MTLDELIDLLNRVLGLRAHSEDGKNLSITCMDFMDRKKEYIIPEDTVLNMLNYNDSLSDSPVCIKSSKYCEFILQEASRIPTRLVKTKDYHDGDNKINYRIGKTSLRMVLALLKYADGGHPEIADELRSRFQHIHWYSEIKDGADLLSYAFPYRCRSLQISLDEDNTSEKTDYLSLCNSFCYVFGFNLGRSLLPIDNLGILVESSINRRFLRSGLDEMEPPRRKYIGELVHFYARGISGESNDYKFLSYYHVVEYFFEKVYSDNVVERMRMELTRPGFSYKRDKDLLGFVKNMRNTFNAFSSSSGVNELEALKLSLKKYVPDLGRLKRNLEEASSTIVDYLKTADSPFSRSRVNLDSQDPDSVYSSLTNRIYETRNAIAHSKETLTKQKFVPFKHDSALIYEVILLRVIAEEVLFHSSKEI